MRGQKVSTSTVKGQRKNKPGPAVNAANASPGGGRNFSMCEGCGKYITAEIHALQCDKCLGNWKCNECLNIGQEQFQKTLDCKELTWLCSGCSKEVMESDRAKNRDDRLVEMMSAVLEKDTGMELGLSQKAGIGVVEELEERVKVLEEKFETECRKKRRQVVDNEQEEVINEGKQLYEEQKKTKRSRKEEGILCFTE